MKAQKECLQCLKRLIRQAVNFSTQNQQLGEEIEKQALEMLENNFSTNIVPTEVSNKIHRYIKEAANNPDPYKKRKIQEMEFSKKLYHQLKDKFNKDIRSCVIFSALGNGIDFFRDVNELIEDTKENIVFSIDDIDILKGRLCDARRVLFLADNAGECYFDLPLIAAISKRCEIVYAVKGGPVQNDITLDDLKKSGMLDKFGKIMSIGADTVGVDFNQVSEDFKEEFERCDLIIAKGMGNYETLSELPKNNKTFHILKVKCQPVARNFSAPLNTYIAMMR